MSSPRWSSVTSMPSACRARTAARASASVSPATNRSTTCRVAGLPVTNRRRPGRREAARRAFEVNTGPPGRVRGVTSDARHSHPLGRETDVQNRRACSHTLVRQSGTFGHNCREGGTAMRDDLQDLVDEVSRLLGAPATLEDADFTLLAFCAHDESRTGAMDAVRTRSILTRGSPEATRLWFEEFGIASAAGPLRTPADPAAGILTRLVIPVRHAGRTRGYLWLLDEGRTDPSDAADPALAAAIDLTAEAGRLLARREPAAGALDRVLRTVLTGGPAARERAARVLSDGLGGTPAQVLVALAPGPDAGWRPPGAGAVSTVLEDDDGPVGAVLVPLRRPGDLR